MAHYGSLGDQRFTADVPDVRGAEDVIFDHETMEIRFVGIEGGDRSQSHKFLVPVNRTSTTTNTATTSTKDRSSRRRAGRSIWTNSRSFGKRIP